MYSTVFAFPLELWWTNGNDFQQKKPPLYFFWFPKLFFFITLMDLSSLMEHLLSSKGSKGATNLLKTQNNVDHD